MAKIWLVTAERMLVNGDHVRWFYEVAGCDDPEEAGVYAILDFEWRTGIRKVQLIYPSLNELAKVLHEMDNHFVVGKIRSLAPIDV